MLLHHSQPPSIKLEDRLVYPHTPTPSQFAPYSNSLGDTVIAWDCYSSNNNDNSNITINNDNNNNNITTLDYYFNSNTNNTNNNYNIFNNNHTNDTNITNNFILNLDYPLHASTTNTNNTTTTTANSNNKNTTQSGFQFNIPIFLSQIKEEIPEQHTTTSHHHRQHHQQQQHHQQHQRQQQAHYSTTPLSSQYPSPHTIANFAAMPTKKATTAKAAAAALAAMPKPPSLPHNASQSNPATYSPLSTASSQQQQQSTTVLPLSSLPSLSSSTTPPSPSSSSSSSVPMKFSVSSSISTSSSTSSSPPSSPPSSSSSPLSCTPLSFTETSYSTSDDKLYLVNNFTPESIVSTMSSSSDHHPNPHKKAKMIDMINNYNADQLKTTINDMSENNNFDLSYSNSFGLFVEGLDSDRLLQRIPLPDIWTTFGHPSPKDTTCCASDVSSCSSMIASDLLEPFETLQDVQLACPFGEDIDTTFFSSMETSCSEGDEEGSHIMSDCGYSSDHTTTQPSPISNESSNDWSGSFNNKLPVFEELQVSNREEEKRRPKRSTPSPGQKKKSKDSSNPNEKERKKPGRKPGQVSNVLHLWEFMRDLLHDPTISDGIIQWVSKSEGVFRVVDSSAVARLWGQKKNNKKEMTYEKLSRSLRYSRLEGYFDNLPKDKNYPKKLCFKFGPKSRHFSTLQGSTASPVNIDH